MRARAVLLLALVIAGCGGKSSPTAPTPQPYSQTMTGTVSVFGTTYHPLTIPRNGQMQLVLTWQQGVDLDMYLTPTSCTGYPPTDCQILAASNNSFGVAREQINRTVIAGETYKVWIDNFSHLTSTNYTLDLRID